MQQDQSDLELIFKKRARRRLVGAIALVLLMVVLLPIVLEDRAETGVNEDIAVVMPDGEGDKEISSELMLAEGEEVLALPNQTETKVEKVPEKPTEPVKSKLKKAEVEKPKVAEKKVVKAKPKPVEEKKVVVAKVTPKKEAPKKETPKQTVAQQSGQFYVQIGVFSNIDNVKKLQVKLDELGYQSVTEKITTATGDKTRLRTKNFDGRNEAAIALANIKDAGLTGMVVSQK